MKSVECEFSFKKTHMPALAIEVARYRAWYRHSSVAGAKTSDDHLQLIVIE